MLPVCRQPKGVFIMLHKRSIKILAVGVAAVMAASLLTACGDDSSESGSSSSKPSIVKTAEGKKLTAHTWQTNYGGHSEVTFNTDGSLTVAVDEVDGTSEADGTWSLSGAALTTVIEKHSNDGEVVDGESKVTYKYADYINDKVFDGGDQAVNDLKEKHKDSTDWYVSDDYLYLNGSVWIPKKD